MTKISKKLVSILLVLCLMCSVFSVNAFAVDYNVENNQNNQTDIVNDMNVKGTNSFGSLLTQELEQETDKQEQNNGINIFSVEVEEKTATAEFETLQDATLVVAIYDESGVEMLATGSTRVIRGDTTANVTIDADVMPDYFYLKAFLVDEEVFRPLCTAYESPNYTQEMQEFFAKTTEDFESDKVLNLDDDNSNNFAVYDDGTKIIEQNANKNQVASVDDDSKKYVIENADSSITSLKSGDIFSYNYGDDFLIVKVKSISISGTTATIYGDEVELDEVFDYVKIDGSSNLSNAEFDPSSCGEGVTYKEIEEKTARSKAPYSVGVSLESSIGTTRSFEWNKERVNYTFKGSLDLEITATAKMYVTWSYQYVELKLDYSAKISFALSQKDKDILTIGYFCISPVLGVIIEFTPSIVVETNGKIEVSGTLKGTLGLRASNTDGIQNISSNPEFKPEIKAEITVFAGLSLEPKVKILSDIITGSMTAMLGAEIKATMKKTVDDTSKQIHECNTCIAGTISAKASLSFEIKFLKKDKYKFNYNLFDFTIKICDFYFSYDFADFGFTTCPHIKYKTTLNIQDSSVLSLGWYHSAYVTENGNLYTWGYGYERLGDGVTTKSLIPIKIMSNIKSVSLGEYHSGVITKNGDLYMWGNNSRGQLGDGTTTDSCTPTKIMSKVKAVSIGEYCSAAITENGDLYMWGGNGFGVLGYGTTDRYIPTKIMSNVKSVSLGNYNSGAITENGDLYMWGWNACGQLGNGTTTDRHTPTKIMSNVKTMSLGYWHSGAITQNGDLYMWGYNKYGQLGDGTTTDRHTPAKIMSNVKTVSLGYWHIGAITQNGDLYMWGYNKYGQLGDGTTTDRHIPTKIMSKVKAVNLGTIGSGAIVESGDLYMWGNNTFGQLGDGTTTDRYTPTKITIPSAKSKSLIPVSASNDCKIEKFTDLLPNEVYNFYSMKTQNAENPFSAVNLLYITQATTDENGNLSITYKPDKSYGNAVNFVVPLKQTDLSTATVTIDNLNYNGETQYVNPVVTLDGKTLVEGKDYYLSGDYFAKNIGSYTLTINGRGLYMGTIDFDYKVYSNIIGDVNQDGEVNIRDATAIQKHLVHMITLDDEQLKLADTNGDDKVDVRDVTQIQKYLVHLIPSLG